MSNAEFGQSPQLDIPDWFELPHEAPLPEFERLRQDTLDKKYAEVNERLRTNPYPEADELSAGAFREQIEPQCREAIFAMRRKGYTTASSGFGFGNIQVVDGMLPLTQPVVDALHSNGYQVCGVGSPAIYFRPEQADLDIMKEKWDRLASLLPDLDHPPLPTVTDIFAFYNLVRRCEPFVSLNDAAIKQHQRRRTSNYRLLADRKHLESTPFCLA